MTEPWDVHYASTLLPCKHTLLYLSYKTKSGRAHERAAVGVPKARRAGAAARVGVHDLVEGAAPALRVVRKESRAAHKLALVLRDHRAQRQTQALDCK